MRLQIETGDFGFLSRLEVSVFGLADWVARLLPGVYPSTLCTFE